MTTPHSDHETPTTSEVYSLRQATGFDAALRTHRTVENSAGFVMPYLTTGLRLLDVGCGPGSITLDLAALVAPGEVVGVDARAAVIEQARADAVVRGISTVRFEVADTYRLPYPDGAFDVVYSSRMLQHLRDPLAALKEMRRVLHAGGIVAVIDQDPRQNVRTPPTPLLTRMRELWLRVMEHQGGGFRYTTEQRRYLLEAGFARTEAGAVIAVSRGTLAQTRLAVENNRPGVAALLQTALEQGWTEPAEVSAILEEFTAWGERPDALDVIPAFWAIGSVT